MPAGWRPAPADMVGTIIEEEIDRVPSPAAH
jgi:hypothetical protein